MFKLLQKVNSSGFHYRGLERDTLGYVAEVETHTDVEDIFYKYLSQAGAYGFLQDLNFARNLIEIYNTLTPNQNFEIVTITDKDSNLVNENIIFLGFDVVCVYRISLVLQLTDLDTISPRLSDDDLIWQLQPLLKLIRLYFLPRLNDNGLFEQEDIAEFYLEVMMSIQAVRPNTWEGQDCEFKVVPLWKVL
jgi:hypothetical protein